MPPNALHHSGVETKADAKCVLSKDFIKRPRVAETAVPHLVDDLGCLFVVLTLGPHAHRQYGPPLDTILMVICKLEYPIPKELIGPPTLSTQRARSNLSLPQFYQRSPFKTKP